MTITNIIERLIEEEGVSASQLIAQALDETMQRERFLTEASVHRPRRGKVFVAYFTGTEPGQQVSRSTQLTDYDQALALAREWERQAMARRMAQAFNRPKPTIRVRRARGERTPGPLT